MPPPFPLLLPPVIFKFLIGKSTLIKVLAGIIKPDSGNRAVQKECRVAYLPQSGLTHQGCTLIEEADKAFEFGYEMQRKIDELGSQLEAGQGNTEAIAIQQADLIQKLDDSGWYRRAGTAESVLLGLGFSRADFDRSTEEFSGGWHPLLQSLFFRKQDSEGRCL